MRGCVSPPETPRYNRRQGLLFTHRGFSGPAVLNISHVFTRPREGAPPAILAEWGGPTRAEWEREFNAGGRVQLGTVLRRRLPERLVLALLAEAGVPADRVLAQLRRDEREAALDALTALPLPVSGDEGYRKAEVTGGGVALSEIDPVTMESRRTPGLFLCGEILDAFGPIGGYNFLWAWATGPGRRARGPPAPHILGLERSSCCVGWPTDSAVLDRARESFLASVRRPTPRSSAFAQRPAPGRCSTSRSTSSWPRRRAWSAMLKGPPRGDDRHADRAPPHGDSCASS